MQLYVYNNFNQTTKVETFDGNVQINRYDAEGLRHEMEENGQLVQFIFNTEREVIAEKENEWTVYIRGSELLASSSDYAKTYYHYATDEIGSITHIVNDKEILNYYEYDVWGNVVNQKETVKNRFKFNGQQFDSITEQYYLRARFYNPVIARFTQEDTYRGDGLNLYAYCKNNPIKYVDPTGNACDEPNLNNARNNHSNKDTAFSLEEVFNKADNYILSKGNDRKGLKHIIQEHSSTSQKENKSKFNADFNIIEGIDSTLKGNNSFVRPNTKGRSGKIFVQIFDSPIGVDKKGKPLNKMKVVISEYGEVITAYPTNKVVD